MSMRGAARISHSSCGDAAAGGEPEDGGVSAGAPPAGAEVHDRVPGREQDIVPITIPSYGEKRDRVRLSVLGGVVLREVFVTIGVVEGLRRIRRRETPARSLAIHVVVRS